MNAEIKWGELPFGYFKADYNVRCYYKDGKWGKVEVSESEEITMHIAATCLHYGQEAFEGLKAYRGKDGKVRLFRWEENAKRLRHSASGVMMPEISDELFFEMTEKVVKLNDRLIPPYGTGASLYLRPLLIGTGAQVGVKPASEYCFLIFAGPVGPYFKEGFKPVKMQIVRDFDRAAPHGTGTFKVGGNYAASLKPSDRAHKEGYSASIFVDAVERKYIDEAGPANFFAIKDNTYITPKSSSILASITNMSIKQLATDLGLSVDERKIAVEELANFEEAGACGTAAVISPIHLINDRETNHNYTFGSPNQAGPISTKLYEELRGIQYGEKEDKHGWVTIL